jgi:hypothetical protein
MAGLSIAETLLQISRDSTRNRSQEIAVESFERRVGDARGAIFHTNVDR